MEEKSPITIHCEGLQTQSKNESLEDKKLHKCDECESKFTLAGSLKKHKLTVHRRETRFKCSTCDYFSFTKTNLKRHLLVHTEFKHGKEKTHKCDECESAFTHAGSLKGHQLSVHRGVTRFKCSTCDYVTFHRTNLKNHLLVHTREKPYKCNVCEYTCKRSDNMKSHKLVHLKEKPHKCNDCESFFTLASRLKSHQLSVHRGVTRYSCSVCGYVTFHQLSFKNHTLLVHPGEKPYKWIHSDDTNNRSSDSICNQLVQRHTKEKPHKCEECESSFTLASSLKSHQLSVHRGLKSFKCSTCDFGTFHLSYFKKHLSSHKAQHLHRCIDCNYLTSSLSGLQSHLSQHEDKN